MMSPRQIDIHNIDDGVDRKQLTQLKQRFLALNHQRYTRTQAALSERQQQFLTLLPLLFHVNHPMLPGYISHSTPKGIFGYQPDKEQLLLAKTLARSFHYNRDLITKQSDIEALFVMGSVGTIAHNETSDLDIWVCHSAGLSIIQLKQLENKCTLISSFAEQYVHLEIHCFLMRSDKFRVHSSQNLSSEASGSAQHYLLLDEFYRTALWLAGKVPLWWFVPATQEHDYDRFIGKLLGKRFIKAAEVIDFGGLPGIPPNEFIGAGIWQLYKAIESPYKSVLKLLLLEVYASNLQVDGLGTIDNTKTCVPLALNFKKAIFAGEFDANVLDPYVMAYNEIEKYLSERGQNQRLELVRRCFYFKVNKPLSRHFLGSWQYELLATMVKSWGWTAHQLQMLDNRTYWKSPKVISERTLLVIELSHSHKLLTELNKHLQLNAAISNEELMILGRKLHAAFERKAGKIEKINPGISRDLGEGALLFFHDQNETDTSWQVLRGSQQDVLLNDMEIVPIKRARALVELLFWCHANGILTADTKVDIEGKDFLLSSVQKHQLIQTIQFWLPSSAPPVKHENFTCPALVQRLLLIFNVGVEPQHELYKKGLQMLSTQRDALGYSGFKESLIVNADIAQINSWGELICRHYSSDALVNCLLHFLRLCPPGKTTPLPQLSIECFSSGQGANIAHRLTELWDDLIACYYSGERPPNTRYILEMGDEYLLVQFFNQQPQIISFKTYEKLLTKLAQAQTDYSPIVIDRYGLRDKPLRVIAEVIKDRCIYIFFEVMNQSAVITIVDEKGSLFSISTQFYNQQTLLRPLIGFMRAVMQRQQLDGQHFSIEANNIVVYELVASNTSQKSYALARRQLHNQLSQLHFVNIKAIAELNAEHHIQFTIFCDEQEFSALALGAQLFTAVAHYIYRRRQQGERYPCYITDLDLSLCRDTLAQQTELQIGHYLSIKAELEHHLNKALQALAK